MEQPAILDGDVRREMIDYHKWVVSLAVFILTTSLALASFLGLPPNRGLLVTGWILITLSITANWLTVKSLITGSVVAATPVEDWTWKHAVFAHGWLKRLKLFGFVQQWSFMLGSAAIGLAFVLRLFK